MTQEALKLALEALEEYHYGEARIILRQALAQPAQEPANDFYPDYDTEAVLVEEMQRMAKRIEELEAQRKQRTWVGLTDADIADCMEMSIQKTCRAVEAKLKEKNNGT